MGYTNEAIRGVSWIGAIRVATRILSFGRILVIARLLSPYQFGLFGIATLALVFVEIFTETGINIFLIQNKKNIDEYIDTSWLVSILRGFFIAIIIISSATLVSSFFKSPGSYGLLILISIVPILRGFINPSVIKFQKELMFPKEFYYRTSIFFIEILFSIIFVLILRSTEALIYGMITGAAFEVILSFFIARPVPKIIFKKQLFKEVIGYGKWVTATTIFNYFYQHGDDMVVGRILGTTSLGIYDMAYRISLVPISDIADVVTKVTFPVYVKISDDLKRLRRAYLRSLSFVILLALPIGLVLFIYPDLVIKIVLGEKWITAAPVLKVLAVFGVVRAVSAFSSSIFYTLQKQNIVTLISMVGLAGLGFSIVPFVISFGILGAGYSALLGTSLTIPVIIYYVYKFLF